MAIVNSAAMNYLGCMDLFRVMAFSRYTSSGIFGLYGSSISKFFEEPPYCFP